MGKQGLLVYVPATYTGQLQPLDVSFNGPFKACLRRAMQRWLAELIAGKIEVGIAPGAINLKEEFKLTNLKAPFCAALDEALRYFLSAKGQRHIVRGFKEAGIMDCFGSSGRELYEKALVANDAGTLFPGGKNNDIDASLDSTVADVPEDTPENVVPGEGEQCSGGFLDILADLCSS